MSKQELFAGQNARHFETRLKGKLFQHSALEVRKSDVHGYGVFTKEFIYKDDLVEECAVPFQTIEPGYEYLDGQVFRRNLHVLDSYRFDGPPDEHGQIRFWMIATGNALVYNHSKEPNIIWRHIIDNRIITFTALRDIQPGEELYFNYGTNYKPNK